MERRLVTQITLRAATQYGLVTLEQLRMLGVTRRHLRGLVDGGWLRQMAPRVYGISGVPPSTERRLMLGLLRLGTDAVVSHEAAARLHRGPFTVHSTRVLPPIDRVRVGRFACTSATRTILDLARARLPTVRLEAAIDSAVRSGATSPVVLATRLADLRGPGRWGVGRLDDLLVDSGGHTVLERRFLELVRTAGLPRPATQVVHRRDGRTIARVDFLFEEHGVVVEVSGRLGHASDAERARDAQRRNELQDVGRRVFEYTSQQVFGHPARVAATLRARLSTAPTPRSPIGATRRPHR